MQKEELALKVEQALEGVVDGEYNQPITKFIDKVIFNDGKLLFNLKYFNLKPEFFEAKKQLAEKCENIIKNDLAINDVAINIISETDKSSKVKFLPQGVKRVIAVASGKGGVGKSTIACAIAKLLNAKGKKVGMLDADIYGPSLPYLFPCENKLEVIDDMFIPHTHGGIEVMSLGYLINENSAAAWRGLMATKTLHQFLKQTKWDKNGILDCLIIDMPPGTGDIHLTLCENYDISSVVLVTTPHQLSVIDVKRAIDFYNKINVNILGIIENMSYLPSSNGNQSIFGESGAKKMAEEFGLNMLDEVPILPNLLEELKGDVLAGVLKELIDL